MKRLLRILFFILSLFIIHYSLFIPPKVVASAEFETAYDVRYQVLTNGKTHVSHNISLTNKLSNVYATRYALTLQVGRIDNVTATDSQGPLKIDIQRSDDQTKIELEFNEKVVGKRETLNFTLSYDAYDLANKTGQVWDVSVPKLSDPTQIDNYSLMLAVPVSFGNPAFISPKPVGQGQEEGLFLYRFNKEQLAISGVNAAFGQFQIFDFVLSYHLVNPNLTPAFTEIALPPDTAHQQVFYYKIEPSPEDVEIDPDGNWLARYQLEGSEKLNITAVGKAKIFTQPLENFSTPSEEVLSKNLASAPYWPVDNSLIKTKAEELKTPMQIYNFVVKTLEYDFSRVEEGVERLGAIRALENPQNAICMEFTDLFITLARAAGIPAREINGFAYTTNSKLRPLSLVTDILHSWPEYWDEEKKIWKPVDPTWEKTTGGVDYFSKIDMNHFVFVIHGQDSQRPYPAGSYKTESGISKDVQVVFGKYEEVSTPQFEVIFELKDEIFFELGGKGKIIIKNKGPSSIYNLPLKLDAQGVILDSPTEVNIANLPSFGQEEVLISLTSPVFKLGKGSLTVYLDSQQFSHSIKIRSLILEKVLPLIIILVLLTFIFIRVKNKTSLFLRNKQGKLVCFLRNKTSLFLRNKTRR